jgi:hypothetical protein
MLVYGEASAWASVRTLVGHLRASLELAEHKPGEDNRRALLIRIGQLEQAIADADLSCLPAVESATDLSAQALLEPGRGLAELRTAIAAVPATDDLVQVKTPEGFAFYCLYPEQYAASARAWAADQLAVGPVLVVGLRSIGTTLAAVVAATLKGAGWDASRVTVRPQGDPFARRVELPIAVSRAAAHALVVDEGPGLSGSSMAAAAEALARAGLPRERIAFLPGHGGEPGPAASAEVRAWWSGAPRYVAPNQPWIARVLADAIEVKELSAGQWRHVVFPREHDWPAVAIPFERAKYRITLANGERRLLRFAGLAAEPDGPWSGAEAEARELARRAPWCPAALAIGGGFVAQPWLDGAALTRTDGDRATLEQVGRYVAAAAGAPLAPTEADRATTRLAKLLQANAVEALGEAARAPARRLIETALAQPSRELPSYGDGRMAPYEWRRVETRLVKLDATGHVLDHTWPGSQSVAWDIAGAAIEWGTPPEPIVAGYRAAGGPPIPPAALALHLAAYAAFRLGLMRLCADSSDGPERARLLGAARGYEASLREAFGC